jgi:hypothetical protein
MKDNRFLGGVLGLLALALIVYVGLLARNASEQFNYIGKVAHDRDTIVVSGEGKVTSQPDLAQVSLGVQTDALTVKDAQAQNTQKMNAIISAVKALQVASKDIQTSNYNIQPKMDWTNGTSKIIGYTVTQNIDVKVRNLDSVGDVLAKGGELGANQVGGITFTVDDPTSLQAQARGKAIDDARTKANALAKQLGLTIVKVVTFSENQGGSPIVYPMMAKAYDAVAAAPAPSPQIQSGSLDVTSDVSVTFEVR